MRALLENAERRFTPGLFARVQMPGSAVFNAMLIDDKSIMTDQDRKFVYIVDKDGKAQRRDIEVGRVADGLRIVRKGLSAGDQGDRRRYAKSVYAGHAGCSKNRGDQRRCFRA
jgi:membrane fusion protein, multidrug efflux system